jgi:hypothetical protein
MNAIAKDQKHETACLLFLQKQNILDSPTMDELQGSFIQRDMLLNVGFYEKIKPHLMELKEVMSSSYFTSMHAAAQTTQQWPLLNLVRQILRSCHYKLTPKRLSVGYTTDGKKKYKRVFIIEKEKV